MCFHIFALIPILPWYTNFQKNQIPIPNGYVKKSNTHPTLIPMFFFYLEQNQEFEMELFKEVFNH
jgi:hypothetical protein